MVTRVPTSLMSSTLLNQLSQSNTNLAKYTYQISSGLKATRFGEMPSDTNLLLNMQDLKKNTDQYIRNIDDVTSKLGAMEGALQSMADLVVEATNVYTMARNENSAEVRATIAPKVEGMTNTFYEIIQTKFGGKFLFSGMASEASPMIGSPTANISPGNPPPTTYYGGDSQRSIVITSSVSTQEYGVTGDNMGFAQMKAGLEALWEGLQNNNVTGIDDAIDHLNEAQTLISDMMGEVGGQISGFNLTNTRHQDSVIFLESRVDDIEKVDVTKAITNFTNEQAVMEASMAVLTRLQSLSLLDFIR